jgi:energy-coupling factor transport system ATP-binding protein
VNGKSLLSDVSLHVDAGANAVVRGKTGSGKSTLGLVAAKLLPASVVADDLVGLHSSWRYLLGTLDAKQFVAPSPAVYLPSNPLDTFIFPSVQDELDSITEDRDAQMHALHSVALRATVLEQELSQLSGGMLQRLALARCALRAPQLFIADEVYEWLDTEGSSTLLEHMDAIAASGGVSLLLQSTAANRLCDLQNFDLSNGDPQGNGPRKRKRKPNATGNIELEARSLSKSFILRTQRLDVFSSVSLSAFSGEWVGIVGKNGSGKSVLCQVLSGLDVETGGTVALGGRPATRKQRAESVGYVFQIPSQQLPLPSFDQTLRAIVPKEARKLVYATLDRFDSSLRSGDTVRIRTPYQQRVAILSLFIAKGKRVLILDEPTWGCDEVEVAKLLDCLESTADDGRVVIIVSHNRSLLSEVCDRVLELCDGTLSEVSEDIDASY